MSSHKRTYILNAKDREPNSELQHWRIILDTPFIATDSTRIALRIQDAYIPQGFLQFNEYNSALPIRIRTGSTDETVAYTIPTGSYNLREFCRQLSHDVNTLLGSKGQIFFTYNRISLHLFYACVALDSEPVHIEFLLETNPVMQVVFGCSKNLTISLYTADEEHLIGLDLTTMNMQPLSRLYLRSNECVQYNRKESSQGRLVNSNIISTLTVPDNGFGILQVDKSRTEPIYIASRQVSELDFYLTDTFSLKPLPIQQSYSITVEMYLEPLETEIDRIIQRERKERLHSTLYAKLLEKEKDLNTDEAFLQDLLTET